MIISNAELAILVQKTRTKLHRSNKGPLHSMWDVVFDAEAILKDEPSICNRETVTKDLHSYSERKE